MVLEQRLPFESVWHGDDELVHVVRDAFVTLPPLAPGAEVRLRFSAERCEAPLVRKPSHKGLTVVDARRSPANAAVVTLVLLTDNSQAPSVPSTAPSLLGVPVLSKTAGDSVDGIFPLAQSAVKSDAPIAMCPQPVVVPALTTPAG